MTILNLTTIARVKGILGVAASTTTYDTTLSTFIVAVSQEVEEFIGRKLYKQSRTEDHTIKLHDHSIWLESYPVATVTSIKIDPSWNWTGSAIASTAYTFNTGTGEVYFAGSYQPDPGEREAYDAVRVVYTGGVGLTAGDVIASMPMMAYATDMQVAEDWRRRNDPATERRGGQSGGVTWTGAHRFLPRVQQLLAPFRRMVNGQY